jgi:hypothetical protein
MLGKQQSHRLRSHFWKWALVIAGGLFVVGGLVHKLRSQPDPVQIHWEYPMSAWQVISRGEPHPQGGVVLCGRDRLDFIDSQGHADSVLHTSRQQDFKYSRFDINHFDTQGNYYICVEDNVRSYNPSGLKRWEVHLDQQTNVVCRFGRAAKCRVSESDQILVVYNSDEFAVIDSEGGIQLFIPLPFTTIIGVEPMDTKDGDYLFCVDRQFTNDTLGLALIDKNGEIHWQIKTDYVMINDVSLYDSTIVVSDMNSLTCAYDLNGNLKWQCSSKGNLHKSRTLQAIRLSGISDKMLCIDFDNNSKLTCFTLDGDRMWSVKLSGIISMASKSEKTQYVTTHQEPKDSFFLKALTRLNPSMVSSYTSKASANMLVELANGKVTKHWELPFEPSTISVGREGELYITSSNEQKLYCVIPE